jgi:hypothetical protein
LEQPRANVGKLFTVNRRTGLTREIVLDEPVVNGDGILLDGRTLYVVQNRDNKVAVVRLARNLESGDVVTHLTDPDFDVPTTIDDFGDRLYALNARLQAGTASAGLRVLACPVQEGQRLGGVGGISLAARGRTAVISPDPP